MLREIHVQRFRGFEKLEAKLAPSTVIVGPNSSGKTTLLHAIRIALRALDEANRGGKSRLHSTASRAEAGWIEVSTEPLLLDHTHYLPVKNWQALFYKQLVGENIAFSIRLIFDPTDEIRELFVRVWCARGERLKFDVEILAPELAEQIRLLPKKGGRANTQITAFIQQHAARAVMVPSFYGVVMEEEYRTGVIVDRLLGSGDQSHIVRNLVSRLSGDAYERLNAFLRETLDASISGRTTSQDADTTYPLNVNYRDTDGDLELSTAGAGLVNLIALYASLERYRGEQRQRPVIFLLDEPEAHLHPRLQGDMAVKISSVIVREFGAQVLMATHAIEIVNRLGDREDTALIRVDRNMNEAVALRGQSEIVNEISQWADLTPFSMINFLAARRVLFHEGETDKDILELCARLRYRNDLRGRDRFRAWALASLSGSGNAPIVSLLARLIKSQAIPNFAGKPVQLVTLLDRDYEREPGRHDEDPQLVGLDGGSVRSTRFVWSRHSIESLFLSVEVLEAWIRAWFDGAPPPAGLREIIAIAIQDANANDKLIDNAIALFSASIASRGLKGDKDGKRLGGEQLYVHAYHLAAESVRKQPEVWQRGKDRANMILNQIRAKLPSPYRNRFQTTIHGLLTATSQDRFGDIESPIPLEIRELLDLMTAEP